MKKLLTVSAEHNHTTLSVFLAKSLDISGRKAKQLLDDRQVFVNRKRIWMARHKLRAGDVIEVLQNSANTNKKTSNAPIKILYQDEQCLVADKPIGVLANGKNSCESLLRKQTGITALRAIHRLDRDTSGCLLFAKNDEAADILIEQFRAHRVVKQYQLIVSGIPSKKSGTIHTPIEGRSAETRYKVIHSGKAASYLHARIATGRTHQIRKHMLSIGHPILGDKQYNTGRITDDRLRMIPRQMLHAGGLTFASPVNGAECKIRSPEPDDFKQIRIKLTVH